ncbi:protein-glutamate O-methyltransferase CheR [Methyloparacoccus murrellii]
MTPEQPSAFLAGLAAWVAERYGLDLAVLGPGSLEEALGARRRASGCDNPADYAERWRTDAAEREALLERLLVGETWFFREWAAFAYLATWVTRQARDFAPAHPLRVLTLPCSTGEEAWSIAAVLAEAGLDGARARIDAVDVNPAALAIAASGRYPPRRLRGQPVARWQHLLRPQADGQLRVDDQLRAMVEFSRGNAMDAGWYRDRDPYHVIFCRNLLIYMNGEARRRICERLGRCLRPGGLLFLGHAEQPPAGLGLARARANGAFAWCRQPGPSTPARETTPLPAPVHRSADVRPAPQPCPEAPHHPAPGQANPPAPPHSGKAATPLALERLRELADQGRYAEALSPLQTPAAIQSLDPEAHALAGILLGALNRRTEAVERLRQALFLDPAHAESLAHLALLLEQGGDPDGADRLRARLAAHAGGSGA